MNVVSLDQVRQARAEQLAVVTADAARLAEASFAFGHMLASDALSVTAVLPDPDHQLHHVVESFFLRRGLTRSRQSWRKEYGKDLGLQYAKMAAPIVRHAFWSRLDELNPIFCDCKGVQVPLIRGWAHRYGCGVPA